MLAQCVAVETQDTHSHLSGVLAHSPGQVTPRHASPFEKYDGEPKSPSAHVKVTFQFWYWVHSNSTVEPSASAAPAAAGGVPVAVPPERCAWATESTEPSQVAASSAEERGDRVEDCEEGCLCCNSVPAPRAWSARCVEQ